MVTEVLETVHR